jgi:hypothetical protein
MSSAPEGYYAVASSGVSAPGPSPVPVCPGDYRAGWYLLDDDVIELDKATGWEPLTHACARSENERVSPRPEPVLP